MRSVLKRTRHAALVASLALPGLAWVPNPDVMTGDAGTFEVLAATQRIDGLTEYTVRPIDPPGPTTTLTLRRAQGGPNEILDRLSTATIELSESGDIVDARSATATNLDRRAQTFIETCRWAPGEAIVVDVDVDALEPERQDSAVAAIIDALDEWNAINCADVRFELGVVDNSLDVLDGDDGRNSIVLSSGPPSGGTNLAFTEPIRCEADRAAEFDILVRTNDFRFATTTREPGFDLRGVLVHELGHVLGLAHSDEPGSVMRESFRSCESFELRALASTDEAGACFLMPCPIEDCSQPPPALDPYPYVGAMSCESCAADDDCGGPSDICIEGVCADACTDCLACPGVTVCTATPTGSHCLPPAGGCPAPSLAGGASCATVQSPERGSPKWPGPTPLLLAIGLALARQRRVTRH